MRRALSPFGLLLMLSVASLCGGETTKLEWNLKEGDVVHVEHTVTRSESLETKGKSLEKKSVLITNLSFTVKEKTGGATLLVQKIEGVQHKTDNKEPLGALEKRMAGGTFTITVGPGAKIAKFEGYETFIKKLADGNTEVEKTARLLLPEDVMRQPAEELWTFLPSKPVSKGTQWRRDASFSLAPFGSFRGTQVYSYDGADEAGEKITCKGTLAFLPQLAAGGPFRLVKAQLKMESSSGDYTFDASAGRLKRASLNSIIKGPIILDVNGTQVEMEITIEQATAMRVREGDPQKKED